MRFIGQESLDAHGTQWFFWALVDGGESPGMLLFHPWGKSIFSHTGANVLDALLAAPLRITSGPVLGYNLWIALLLLGNGVGAERMARALRAGEAGRALAFVAGMFCPYALLEIQQGRPTQAMLLFCALFLARLAEPPTRRGALWAGLWLTLACLGYWYYGLICGVLALVNFGVRGCLNREFNRAEWERIGLSLGLSLILLSPLIVPMFMSLAEGSVPGLLATSDWDWRLGGLRLETVEGKPQGLFVMSLQGATGSIRPGEGGLEFLPGPGGLSLLQWLLVPAALLLARPRAVWLGSMVLALLFMAWGPCLIWEQPVVVNPIYALPAEQSDILRRWWWPGRAIGPLSVLLWGIWGAIIPDLTARWRAALGVGGVAAVVATPVSRGFIPMESWKVSSSPAIQCLSEAPEGAVIELPYLSGQRPLYHQTLHHKPMLNGMLITHNSFQPPELRTLRSENSFLLLLEGLSWERRMSLLRGPGERAELGYLQEDRLALLELGYRYVLFRKAAFVRVETVDGEALQRSAWERAARMNETALGEPAFEDDELAIYTLDGTRLSCD